MQAYYWGKYKAFVRDTDDPEKRGRIRCFCPSVMGALDDSQHWLDWAEPCFPWLGGFSTIDVGVPPAKKDNAGEETLVWVEFANGHPDFPIWVGVGTIAPTATDARARAATSSMASAVGGSIVSSPPTGSSVDDINPPTPSPTGREVRLLAKQGVDIYIGVKGGGALILSASGVDLAGPIVRANGRTFLDSSETVVG